MKRQVIPHFSTAAPWWTGIILFNYSDVENIITASAIDSKGKLERTWDISLAPFGRCAITPENIGVAPGTYALLIDGPDDLMITPQMQKEGVGIQSLPVYAPSAPVTLKKE